MHSGDCENPAKLVRGCVLDRASARSDLRSDMELSGGKKRSGRFSSGTGTGE